MNKDCIEQTFELMDKFVALGVGRMILKAGEYSLELESKGKTSDETPDCKSCGSSKNANENKASETASSGAEELSFKTKGDSMQEDEGVKVTAPMVGVFFSRPNPESEPYVSEGSEVAKGQVIGMIEAMKMFNEITAPCDGTIEKIGAVDNDFVEFGKLLFLIKPVQA